MKYYVLYIKIFFLIPIILLFFIIRIFKNFKINKIVSHTIGEMTTPIEIHICEKKDDLNKTPVIWFMEKTVANQFIKKQWSQKLLILPRHILEPIYFLFNNLKFLNFFLIDYSKDSDEVKRTLYGGRLKRIDDNNVLLKYGPSIEFNSIEKDEGESYLKKIGLENKKFIVFASRTAHFKNEKFETARNSDIHNKIPGLKFMTSKGYKAIRLGKNETKKISFNDSNIIDYAISTDRSDFLDVYLVSKSEFMISSNHGVNELPVLFRKPRLIVDFYAIPALEFHPLKLMIMPKKFKNLKTGDLVSFEEAFEKKLNHININAKVNELGYGLINNNELEIKLAIENFYKLMNNSLNLDEILHEQQKYWQNIEKYFGFKNKNKTIICPDFYLNNSDLFK